MAKKKTNVVDFGEYRDRWLFAWALLRASKGDPRALALVKARLEGAELTEHGRAFFRAEGLL